MLLIVQSLYDANNNMFKDVLKLIENFYKLLRFFIYKNKSNLHVKCKHFAFLV